MIDDGEGVAQETFSLTCTGEGMGTFVAIEGDLNETGTIVFSADDVEGNAALAAASGLTGDDALPGAVPFSDGVPNLLKFAFNMNLARADVSTLAPGSNSGLPSARLDEAGEDPVWRVEFVRRKGKRADLHPPEILHAAGRQFWADGWHDHSYRCR